MVKYVRGAVLAAVFLMLLTGTAAAMSVQYNDVVMIDNGKTTIYQTTADTVGAFLNEQVYIIGENDVVNLPLDFALLPSYKTTIEITRGLSIEVSIDGEKEMVSLPPNGRLGTLVRKMEEKYGETFDFDGKVGDPLRDKQKVELHRLVQDEIVTSEKVPFETEFIMDDQLDKGMIELVRQGVNGEKQVTTFVSMRNGQLAGDRLVDELVTREPITRIIRQGTRQPEIIVAPASQVLQAGKKYTMNASAYHAGPESTGKSPGDPGYGVTASGMRAQYGVVAVDPDVIPLGTRLYIDGYGYAVAGDTGGRITGRSVDLFFEEIEDCLAFGRRDITVYVLGDE